MTRVPFFRTEVRVRLNAPSSKYHDATGTVDGDELERVRGKDKALTLTLDDGGSTIAFGDELQPIDEARGTRTDNGVSRPNEAPK